MKKKYIVLIYFSIFGVMTSFAQNLISNGDFESGGNGVGFSINSALYNEITQPFSGTTSPGNYAITTNPQPMNTNFFIAGGDHTSGSGKMLVVDATSTGGSQRFWRAGNNGGGVCGLTVGATYTFSYWIKSVSIEVTNNNTRANIGYQFNNATNITLIAGAALAPLPDAGWQQVKYTFTPTNNCVNFELFDINTNGIGNDFALDDFALFGPPQPLTLTYSAVNLSCASTNNGSIIGYGAGANPPYYYYLTGPVTLENATGIFNGLPAGTYSLKVLEAADGELTINNITISAPQDLTVSAPTTICSGDNTTLSVSGSTTGYQWTASPTDSSLIDTTSSNPIVQPAQTTTYTVTSSITNSNNNLVFNGDFSAGNLGFQTSYVYYSPNNAGNLQRAYGIATNANAWEIGFSGCIDHTSGTGKMMVVDGSNINGGNDKVWCQTITVTPNQNYTFKYFVQTLALPTPANLDVVINGVSIGSALAPSSSCSWVPRSYVWNSGSNTTAKICIYDRETVANGNDFAIDDISFIGDPVVCNLSKSVTITVNQGTTPSFDPVTSICSGGSLNPLPTTSLNGITGTWTPPLNNTSTTLYTFTPNPNQCATTTTLQIVVNGSTVTPTFNFGATETYCFGAPINAPLPNLSTNSITGGWNPVGIDTQILGTTRYTYTPNANQCATPFYLDVTILPNSTPTFLQVAPICAGETLNPLPLTSSNNITGVWTPDINNNATTTYTFTPNANQCASIATMEIVVNNNVTPIFDFGDSVTACYQPISEGPQAPLPTTSNNGVEGFWSPIAINYSLVGTTVYTFTPNNNCATSFTLTVTITDVPSFTINSGCIDDNFVLSTSLFEIKENSNFTWYNDQNEVIGNNDSVIITKKGTYKVVKELNGCSREESITVPSIYCKIPKGISPNDDDLNDFFDLSNLNVKELEIFNRYGTKVYSKQHYKKEWDGRADNGNELPDGTYFYVINFETGKSKTGWVYINK